MKAGDILLFHRPSTLANFKADPMGTLMCALIHLTTRSRFNHAALAVSESEYVEAVSGGVCISKIGSTADEVTVVAPAYDDDDDRNEAVAWGMARAGVKYGYVNAFVCGFNNVIVGLGFVVKQTDSIICSELVAEALERAGFDFGKDSALVAPGDLATAFGVPR